MSEHRPPKPTPVTEMIIPTYHDPLQSVGQDQKHQWGAAPMSDAPEAQQPGRYQLPEGHAAYGRPGETAPRTDANHFPSIGTGTTLADLMEAAESLFGADPKEPFHDPMYKVLRPYLISREGLPPSGNWPGGRPLRGSISLELGLVKVDREWLELPPLRTPLRPVAQAGVACTIGMVHQRDDGGEVAILRRTEADGTVRCTMIDTDDPVITAMFTVGDVIRIEGISK